MWKWAQGAVASVTGAAEPEYGPEAFHSIDKAVAGTNPFGALTDNDYRWVQPPQSHVETQTFYFHSGPYFGFAQLIHSNPVNLSFTSQFTFLLHNSNDPQFKVWGSHRLEQAEVVDGVSFKADRFNITLNADRTAYHFAGFCGDDIQVDLTFTRVGDGFKIGKDGYSKYGTDPENPWGTMRHFFWPRCTITGTIVVKSKGELVDVTKNGGQGLMVMALQGMKPHHLAARWNFLNFQGKTLSITAMEFVTPPSYGCQRSAVGAVVKDGELLMTAVNVDIAHTASKEDEGDEANWPMPTAIRFSMEGPKPNGALDDTVRAEVQGELPNLVDRVDVMAELPSFVKRVASGLSGARPFIYQYHNELTAEVTINGEKLVEKGLAFSEATFISEI